MKSGGGEDDFPLGRNDQRARNQFLGEQRVDVALGIGSDRERETMLITKLLYRNMCFLAAYDDQLKLWNILVLRPDLIDVRQLDLTRPTPCRKKIDQYNVTG